MAQTREDDFSWKFIPSPTTAQRSSFIRPLCAAYMVTKEMLAPGGFFYFSYKLGDVYIIYLFSLQPNAGFREVQDTIDWKKIEVGWRNNFIFLHFKADCKLMVKKRYIPPCYFPLIWLI